MSEIFEAFIQPRFRDINPGAHVDSVECLRLMDEARLHFFRWAELSINEPGVLGLFAHLPREVGEVIASHHINYLQEVLFTGREMHRVEVVVSRIGGSSFDVTCRLFVPGDDRPSLVGTSTTVLRNRDSKTPWQIEGTFRKALEHYLGEPVALR